MFHNTRVFSSIRPRLISFFLLILCTTGLLGAAPRFDVTHDETACQGAVFLDDITWIDRGIEARGNQVYALDLDQEGLINVEATHLGMHPGQPQLEIFDARCRPLSSAFAIHGGHRAALIPSSETYYLRISNPGSRTTSEYRLQIAFASMSQLASSPSGPVNEDEPTDPWEELTSTQQATLQTGTQGGPVNEDEPTDPWEELTSTQQATLQTGTQGGPVNEDEPTDPWEELASTQQASLQTGTQGGPVNEDEPTDPWEELASTQQASLQTGTQGGPVNEDEPTDPWEEFASTQQATLQTGTQGGPVNEDEPTDPWEEFASTQQASLQTGTQGGPVNEDEPTDPWEEMVGSESVNVLAAFADWRRAQTSSPWQSSQNPMATVLEAALCPRLSHGDDGDTLGCATEIRLGGILHADMQHAELDDRDTYTFVLHQRAQITLASHGDLDLRGMLYDADGQQLATDDEGAGRGNFRLEATLDAGRYYLRVDSLDGYTGDYELLSAVAPEAWRVAAHR